MVFIFHSYKEGNTKTVYSTERNDILLQMTVAGDKFNLTRRGQVLLKRLFYDASSRSVLWLETYSSGGAILSLRLGQNKPKILIELDDGNPGDAAIDIVTNKVYVTDSELSTVVVYDMLEAKMKTRLNIIADWPFTIVLDSKERWVLIKL